MNDTRLFRLCAAAALCLHSAMMAAHAEQPAQPLDSVSSQIAQVFSKSKPSLVRVRVENPMGTLSGSGFFTGDGSLVVTSSNMAVVGDSIWLEYQGQNSIAKIVGVDRRSSVAVLKSDLRGVPLPLADKPACQPGKILIAAGFPYNLDAEPKLATVSAIETRSPEGKYLCASHIRTAMQLVPGLVGSPFLDSQGHVAGLVTGSLDKGASTYALPADQLARVVKELTEHGQVRPGWVGITIEADSDPAHTGGVRIKAVADGAPAAAAGIRTGDIITKMGGRAVLRPEDVIDASFVLPAGTALPVAVKRGTATLDLVVKVGDAPAATPKPLAGSPEPTPLSLRP